MSQQEQTKNRVYETPQVKRVKVPVGEVTLAACKTPPGLAPGPLGQWNTGACNVADCETGKGIQCFELTS
jgi:hypothetical protein